MSGIVTVLGGDAHLFRQYLDELIEEGLVECHDGGGSLGHPESNRWYMPIKGYNLWKDGIENGSRHSDISFLTHVRLYLGAVEHDEEPEYKDEDTRNKGRWLNPSAQVLIQNPDFMKSYSEWLERNSEELEIMKNLDDFYDSPTIEFSTEETEWIKSRGWYEKNKTVSNCLKLSIDAIDSDKERLSLTKRIIELYKSDTVKYKTELEKSQKDIDDIHTESLRRKKLNKWLENLEGDKLIQECI